MTAGELVAELARHNPDTAVRVVVEDEFGGCVPVDLVAVNRPVYPTGAVIELVGAI